MVSSKQMADCGEVGSVVGMRDGEAAGGLKFAANLTMWYAQSPFDERLARARAAGFSAVEFMFPYREPLERLSATIRHHQLEVVLFNLPAGDVDSGERGIAVLPDRADEFKRGLDKALLYARELDCRRLNCLAGIRPPSLDPALASETLLERVRYAADALAAEGRTLLIEPVNPFDIPGFFLNTADHVLRLIAQSERPNVKLQYDVYHQQRTRGELIATFQRAKDYIGHLQVADNPGRHQPGTGEINFANLWRAFEEQGYSGYIGLEYLPVGGEQESLRWWREYLDHHRPDR